MLHKYRKKVPIEAEQFDGSKEMRRKYGIYDAVVGYGFQDKIETVLPVGFADPNMVNSIQKEDWIVKKNDGYYPIPDDIFQRTYERCD